MRFNSSASSFVRTEPPVWRQKLEIDGSTVVTSAIIPNDRAKFICIEVDDNAKIRYEIQPGGPNSVHALVPSAQSPSFSGVDLFEWIGGATLSFYDADGSAPPIVGGLIDVDGNQLMDVDGNLLFEAA